MEMKENVNGYNNESLIYIYNNEKVSNKMLYIQAIIEQEKGKEGEIFVNGDINNNFNPYFREKV